VTARYHNQPLLRRWRVPWGAGVVALLLSSLCCATLSEQGQPLVPSRYQVRTGEFVILSNYPMTDDPPAVRALVALERDMKEHLRFQPSGGDAPVEIYVLDSRNAFAHFLKFYYPDLPPRRAFFLAQGQQRVVYTYSSPRLEEDLRHEATHALLHGSFGDLPLWLDEGLAEYFEDDLAQPSADRERLDQISKDLSGGWVPNLVRLESLTDIRELTPRDYREAWAWVHLLLNEPNRDGVPLLTALGEPAGAQTRLKFSARGATNDRLLAHLKLLESRAVAAAPDTPERSVRLQDPAVTQASNLTPSPRSFAQRFRAWLGL
jgi:hypothetical protein